MQNLHTGSTIPGLTSSWSSKNLDMCTGEASIALCLDFLVFPHLFPIRSVLVDDKLMLSLTNITISFLSLFRFHTSLRCSRWKSVTFHLKPIYTRWKLRAKPLPLFRMYKLKLNSVKHSKEFNKLSCIRVFQQFTIKVYIIIIRHSACSESRIQ